MLKVLRLAAVTISIAAALSVAAAETQGDPAKARPKEYMVFFADNSAQVTGMADAVLSTAAGEAASARKIEIYGRTDTSEDDPMNLSLRRANAVGEALYRHGLPVSVTVVETNTGAGRSLLVPTGPNTPQPQNRIVDIYIYR